MTPMAASVYVCPEVAALRTLYAPLLDARSRSKPIREQLAAQADLLLQAHAAGNPAVQFQVSSWHPNWIGEGAAAILAGPFDLADARLTLAREHGYRDWAQVDAEGATPPDAAFEDAVDAVLFGDLARLRALLADAPDLASRQSDFAHRAGLIHYVAANGVESWRQIVPDNAEAIVALLIAAGADVNAEAPIYGGSRPLGLVQTSAHPLAAGLADDMAATLVAAGAH